MDTPPMPANFTLFLHQALRAPTQPNVKGAPLHAAEEFSPGDSKRFKPIIDGIHFSLQFILTYQLVLILLLLVFTIKHWRTRLKAWKKRRGQSEQIRNRMDSVLPIKANQDENVVIGTRSVGSSSSSSTLGGNITPPQRTLEGERTEQTPLLREPYHKNHSRWWLFTGRIKAWLTYQPAPIPIVHKTLPSNGSSLAILVFLGIQAFYLFFKIPMSLTMLFVFADRASLLFVSNLPLLYLFAAKNQPIKLMTGYSYESLNIIHRRLGEVMFLLVLLHSVGMMMVWYTILRPSGITLVHFLLIRMILLGIFAFVVYELIFFTSLGSFRQRWYELFLGLHVILQVVALVLVWFHHPRSRVYVGIALGIFLVDRLVYRTVAKTSTMRASLNVQEDMETVVLSAPVSSIAERSLYGSALGAGKVSTGWKATEHVFLAVPAMARKHVFQAHPFTIASSAPRVGEVEANLKLIIRAQNGFSRDLLHYAKGHDSVNIRLDGPYGSQSAVQLLEEGDYRLVIAGGSGIAVVWPLICALLQDSRSNDPERSTPLSKKGPIMFVWIIREESHLTWLGKRALMDLEMAGIKCYVPPPTAENGHPDIHGIINDWVSSFDRTDGIRQQFGVVASGPDGLNRTVRNVCAALIHQGMDVKVEIEKFGW